MLVLFFVLSVISVVTAVVVVAVDVGVALRAITEA